MTAIDLGALIDAYLIVTADVGGGTATVLASTIGGAVASPVSEPATLTLLAGGFFGLAWLHRRRVRRSEGRSDYGALGSARLRRHDLPFAPALD